MATEVVRYRRVSVTSMDGRREKYDARVDVEADPATGVVTYRVYSQVLVDRFVPFRSYGNAAEDAIQLEIVCQKVYEFDQQYRMRPVPKPGGPTQKPAVVEVLPDRCPRCGGDGWGEDDTGYPMTCECRG